MKYLVPSSKIVFTDFMILLVSVLMGLNSVMSFSEDKKEVNLPPVNLPAAPDAKDAGSTAINRTFITIKNGEKEKIYFYNEKEVTLWQLVEFIQKAKVPAIILRGDRETHFEWEEFCQLTSQLMKAGVKEISYTTMTEGGTRP